MDCKCVFFATPWKINVEPENHLFELESHLNQTFIFWVQILNFPGCMIFYGGFQCFLLVSRFCMVFF